MNFKKLGAKLKELRVKADLSLEDVAQDIGYAPATVQKWERGIISHTDLVEIRHFYGINTDDYWEDDLDGDEDEWR